MSHADRRNVALAGTIVITITMAAATAATQSPQFNDVPNPYRPIENWAQLPSGVHWGAVISVDVDAKDNLWVS